MPSKPLTVCLTGGGTAGHVTPHFALLPTLRSRGWAAFYIGSSGLEKPLVLAQGLEFKTIATGKLRRYLSVQNALDLFKVMIGCCQALFYLLRRRPDVVFSKGGFVAVPVAWAAFLLRIPVVSHESDLTPGLATRLIAPLAKRLLYTFPETGRYLGVKGELVGTPVRAELLQGDRSRGLSLCGFDPSETLATYLVMGGSQGAARVNDALLALLPELVKTARVIHLTGKGKGLAFSHPRYKGFEYVSDELKDLYAACDFIVSRAGANSLFEFLALHKPMLLIPLEIGSRGDQLLNANAFVKSGWALVLRETALTPASLQQALTELRAAGPNLIQAQSTFSKAAAADQIVAALEKAVGGRLVKG